MNFVYLVTLSTVLIALLWVTFEWAPKELQNMLSDKDKGENDGPEK